MLSSTACPVNSGKSRHAGKRLLILLTFFFTLCFFYSANAQKLVVVILDQGNASLAIPSDVGLSPGDTLQFVSINGEFDILITDAYKFLKIKEDDLKIRLDSSTNPQSDKYIVRGIKEYKDEFNIYCISNNSWPEAPPRIIIQVQ